MLDPWIGLTPRSWQARCLQLLLPIGDSPRTRLVHAVMGAGKTALIGACAASTSGRVLVVEPTLYLVAQTRGALRRLGEPIGECSGEAQSVFRRIVVSTADSIERAGNDYALVIVDEAHTSQAPRLRAQLEILRATSDVIGFSATPARAGKEGLDLFDEVAFRYTMADALKDGVVVPPQVVSYSGSAEASLDEVCADYCYQAVQHLGPGVVNASSIADAKRFAKMLDDHGMKARCIHSEQDRDECARFVAESREGKCQVLVHVNMLAEGVDLPWLRWIVLRRATGSKIRFAQEVGRVLRAHPGKTFARIYDPQDLFSAYRLDVDACLDATPDSEPAPTLTGFAWGDTVDVDASCSEPLVFGIGKGSRVRIELSEAEEDARARIMLSPSTCRTWDRTVTSAGVSIELDEALPIAGRVTVRRCDWREQDARRAHAVRKVDNSLSEAQALLRSEAVALDAAGLVTRKLSSRSWRKERATAKQLDFAARLLVNGARHLDLIDPVLRECVDRICRVQLRKLDRGSASDLITIALAVVKGDLDAK